jgi:hydrogenase nickel incorporation protein HypA/HybF
MHERSLVRQLIEQVEDEVRNRHLSGLTTVHLEVGEFSGVEPSLLELAFQEMAVDKWPTEVRLEVNVTPLAARCRQCGEDFRVERFRFVCPRCKNAAVDVIAGEDMRLVSLTVANCKSTERVA